MVRKKRAQKRTGKKSLKGLIFDISDLKKKIAITLTNLLLFIVLSLVFFLLYLLLQNQSLKYIFSLMTISFVSLSVAFLIVFVILFILKTVKKK